MCLYPRLIQNPKYKPNKKNGGQPPKPSDTRLLAVAIGCGNCIECRRQLANEWIIRLSEELKYNNGYFVTLTFSENSLNKIKEYHAIKNEGNEGTENEWATTAVRLFLERWRKKYKKSVKHWLITELGHENTERIHLHGIIFTDEEKIKELNNIWSYGFTDTGEYCNKRTINYITKYVTKIDNDHKNFKGKILCSAGIGNQYLISKEGIRFNGYREKNTREYYRTTEGYKLALPIYYRNNIYSEEEREKLWIQKMDDKKIWVMGVQYDISTEEGIKEYLNALKTAQRDNLKNGYGKIEWNRDDYKRILQKYNKLDH